MHRKSWLEWRDHFPAYLGPLCGLPVFRLACERSDRGRKDVRVSMSRAEEQPPPHPTNFIEIGTGKMNISSPPHRGFTEGKSFNLYALCSSVPFDDQLGLDKVDSIIMCKEATPRSLVGKWSLSVLMIPRTWSAFFIPKRKSSTWTEIDSCSAESGIGLQNTQTSFWQADLSAEDFI